MGMQHFGKAVKDKDVTTELQQVACTRDVASSNLSLLVQVHRQISLLRANILGNNQDKVSADESKPTDSIDPIMRDINRGLEAAMNELAAINHVITGAQ